MTSYDIIIIGAGLYGLYAAEKMGRQGKKVLVLEYDDAAFKRATYINQARVHMGYHYPRSYSTAIKSAKYFDRFNEDYPFCIHSNFKKVYATSTAFSWTNAEQFNKFCINSHIPCERISSSKYFNDGMCDGVFETHEYTYDARLLKEYLLEQIQHYSNVEFVFNARIDKIVKKADCFEVYTEDASIYSSDFVLNATYASTNQIINKIIDSTGNKLGYNFFNIKYELCEIILCSVNDEMKNLGITVMDGPFFSIMPFGKTGYHSLTSVTFTPHVTSYENLPTFECQNGNVCSPTQLCNCNDCVSKPESAWVYMSSMAHKYLKSDLRFEYVKSLFSMKPILQASEIDDSRPTVIREISSSPRFISVLSGKINTVYDLDEVLK